jgi:hypothetical protein
VRPGVVAALTAFLLSREAAPIAGQHVAVKFVPDDSTLRVGDRPSS